jgi:hypothetical protein
VFLEKKSLALVFVLAAGCDEPDEPQIPEATVLIRSQAPHLKFKGGRRLGLALGRALGLEPGEICQELGTYDCIEDAHRIALGGVEPYLLRFNRPLHTLPVTSLQAVERVVLSACGKAMERDQSLAGLTAESTKEELRPVVESFYHRLLQRDVSEAEAIALLGFFDEVKATSDEPVREWAVLSCFAVGTSVEALFY